MEEAAPLSWRYNGSLFPPSSHFIIEWSSFVVLNCNINTASVKSQDSININIAWEKEEKEKRKEKKWER